MLKMKHLDRALKHQQLLDRARDRQSRSDEDRRASPEGQEPGRNDAPKTESAGSKTPTAGCWLVVDHANNDEQMGGPFRYQETAAYARSTLELNASNRQNEAWNLWVVFRPQGTAGGA
jgi:hypothetical protein